MEIYYELEENSEEENEIPENISYPKFREDISLWDVCEICDELQEYTKSVGIPVLNSYETVNYLYTLLQSQN